MKQRLFLLGYVLALALVCPNARGQDLAGQTARLKVGDKAPDFSLPDQNMKQQKLADFRGKQTVVLAFYVLAFTGGWTREVQNYRDNMAKFRESNTQVLGISVDSFAAQKEFGRQNNIEFPLLSDFKRDVSRAYGVLNEEQGFANRVTFVIDKEGIIRSIETGKSAIDVSGSLSSCAALK